MKRILACLVIFVALFGLASRVDAVASLVGSGIDSGGAKASGSSKVISYQSISPFSGTLMSSGSGKSVLHETRFSSQVTSINGFSKVFVSKTVTLNADAKGLVVSKVEFKAEKLDGTVFANSGIIDSGGSDGWKVFWNTVLDTSDEVTVNLFARANDGLSWGPWLSVPLATVVDNKAPVLSNLGLSNEAFSPNGTSSIGVKDTTEFSFQISEKFMNNWTLSLTPVTTSVVERVFTGSNKGTVTQIWNGKKSGDVIFSPESVYNYVFKVTDQANNQSELTGQLVLDNTAPVLSSVRFAGIGKDFNTQLGNLSASWNATDVYDALPSYTLQLAQHAWSPNQLPGLQLWFDAMDETTFYSDAGTTTWEDKSGYQRDAVQSVVSKKPVLMETSDKVKYVSFDGVDDSLAIKNYAYYANTPLDGLTAFVVFKSNSTSKSELLSFGRSNLLSVGLLGSPNTGKVSFSSKHLSGGSASGLAGFDTYNDNKFHTATTWWKKGDAEAKRVGVDSGTMIYTSLNSDKSIGDSSNRFGYIGADSSATTFNGGETSGFYYSGGISEIIVYDRALTDADKRRVEAYLHTKWGTNPTLVTWNVEVPAPTTKSWTKLNVKDTTYFAYQLSAEDKAGNKTTTISRTVMTPDRTAPVISPSFTTITGIEDINFNVTPSNYISDNWVESLKLAWEPRRILAVEGGGYSEGVIKSIRGVGVYKQGIEIKLESDANTDPSSGGNRYGKPNAFVWLKLSDRAGNYTEKKIQTIITPVNDAPRFLTEIGAPTAYSSSYYLLHPDTGKVVFNEKFNEDESSPELYLDHYIDDVDNYLSDLTWTVFGPNIYPDGIGTGVFKRNDFTFLIGDAASAHKFTLVPPANWWGDEKAIVGVSDSFGAVATRDFVARVWPVNDKPLISASLPKTVVVNEDNTLSMDLSDYENDVLLEDTIPTYNINLKWSVVPGYPSGIVKLVEGEGSDIDILTFTPTTNAYGTVNVVLKLTDSDQLPSLVYPMGTAGGGYTPSPLSTTTSITLVWKPVNDRPVIADGSGTSFSNYTNDEDSSAWDLGLSGYRNDVEDSKSSLTWSFSLDRSDLITVTYNRGLDKFVFTPKSNAWGTTNVLVSLTDNDTGISFTPYTPNPLSATKNIVVVLRSVNDIPELDSVSMRGLYSIREDKVMTNDKITATVLGYTDVGYLDDVRKTTDLGDEYAAGLPEQNVKHYLYKWYSDGVPLSSSFEESSRPTASLLIDPSYEGKTITLEVAPYDGLDSGSILSKSIKVNWLPSTVSLHSTNPSSDAYFTTGNIAVTWSSVSDTDTDDSLNIGYRAKAWKVEKLGSAPSDTSIESGTAYYDSDWLLGKTTFDPTDMRKKFEHGTYYWKVWTGNQFASSVWDFGEPEWINNFNVDLIAPEIIDIDNIIQVKNIGSGAIIEDAGLTRVLFGTKPVDNINDGDDEGYLYQLRLGWTNQAKSEFGEMVTTTGDIIMVDFTDAAEWSYTISYPRGTTTYNVYVQDIAGNIGTFKKRHISGTKPEGKSESYTYSILLDWRNEKVAGGSKVYASGLSTIIDETSTTNWKYAINYIEGTTTYNVIRRDIDGDTLLETFTLKNISEPSKLYSFSIVDDTTPPSPFKINNILYTYFADVSSKNYYQISGQKEKDAGLFFRSKNPDTGEMENSQIVGFTKSENFIATIYQSRPSGNLSIQDRNGNVQSITTTVNIRFFIGKPSLGRVTANPEVINSIANKASLPSDVGAIFASKITWISSRNTTVAQLKNSSGALVAQTGCVTANTKGLLVVSGNLSTLSHGANRLTFSIQDEAKNVSQTTITLNVLKDPPSTAIILSNSQLVKVGSSWRVKVFGETKSFVSVKINGEAVTKLNNGTWLYEKSSFDPQTTNLTLQVTDSVYNTSTKKIWDKSYFSKYGSKSSIDLPIVELSLSMVGAKSGIIKSIGTLPDGIATLSSEWVSPFKAAISVSEQTKQEALITNQNKIYEIFAADQNGSLIKDLDLKDAEVVVELPFTSTTLTEEKHVRVVRFNALNQRWEDGGESYIVDLELGKVTTTLPSLGLYTVLTETPFGESLKDVRVYPNPWVPNDSNEKNGTLETGIVFDYLTTNSKLTIYTISGEKVIQIDSDNASYQWKAVNESGKAVSSGVYLYIITDGKTTKRGKITIIR